MERDPLIRTLVVLLIAAVAVHLAGVIWNLLVTFGDIVAVFFLAWVLAFIVRPLAQVLNRLERVSWPLAVGVVYGLLLVMLLTVTMITVPAAISQVDQITQSVPALVDESPTVVQEVQAWLDNRRIPIDLAVSLGPDRLAQRAETIATALAQNTLTIAQGIVTVAVQLIIVLMISFYLTLEGERMNRQLLAAVPASHREDIQYFFECIDRTFGGFLRATLVMVSFYGVANALVMTAAGLKFVVVLSIFAGAAMLVPFVGPLLALMPPLAVAAVEGPWTRALIVAVMLLAIQQFVLYGVMPRLLRATAGIHPLLVLLAILIGAKIAGFWGAVFGVPVVGVTYAMAIFVFERATRRNSASQAAPSASSSTTARAERTAEQIREGVVHEDPEGRSYSGRLGDAFPARD